MSPAPSTGLRAPLRLGSRLRGSVRPSAKERDGVSVQYSPRILLASFRLADRIHAHPNLFFPPAAAEDRARSFCRATPVGPVRQRGAPGVPFKAGTRRDSTDTLWKWRSLPGPTTCAGDRISHRRPAVTRLGHPRFARSARLCATVLHAKAWTRGLTGSPPLLDERNDGAWLGRCARGRDGRSAFSRRSRNQGRSPCPSRSRRNPRRRPVRVPTPGRSSRIARSTCSSLRCFQWEPSKLLVVATSVGPRAGA